MPRDHPKNDKLIYMCTCGANERNTKAGQSSNQGSEGCETSQKTTNPFRETQQKTTNLFRRVHYLNLTVMPTPTTNKHDKNQLIHLDLTYSEKILKLAYKLLFFFFRLKFRCVVLLNVPKLGR